MPEDFQLYITAVIAKDSETTKLLATQLDIENLDAFCIKGMFGG